MKEFIIQKNEENQRFDKYLKKLLPNAGSAFLYKMMRKKNIILNGKKATGSEKLTAGDEIRIFLSDETFDKFHINQEELKREYEALKNLHMHGLQIVYEDDEMIAADKPYNMLSQKAVPSDRSVNEYLLGYVIRKGDLSFEEFQTFRPSVVNRLDRNTTGLILFGKTLHALQELGDGIKKRRIEKYYLAVVAGELQDELELKGYLKKNEGENKAKICQDPCDGAEYIETGIRPLQSKNGCTLLEVHLVTGKTHQIRLHLSSIGHPIIGDMKYGNQKINKKYYESHHVDHQLLHAYRLEFPDGRIIRSEPSKVFRKLLE